MPCDAQTLENLGASLGYIKLSEYDLLVALAQIHTNTAGFANAQAAVVQATTNGYAALSDEDLDTCYLAVTCATCEAQAATTQAVGNGYLKLSDGDVAATVASRSASTPVQTLLNSAYAKGYSKLSERMLKEVTIAGACTANCTAKQVLASAVSDGYLKLSEKGLADLILNASCVTFNPAFVSAAVNNGGASSVAITVTKSVTAGNLLVWVWFGSAASPSPSDGVNTWTKDTNSPFSGSGFSGSVWYCVAQTTGSITVTASVAATFSTCSLMEYSGLSARDSSTTRSAITGNTGLNGETTGSVTTSNPCMVIGIINNVNTFATSRVYTAGTSPNAFNDRTSASHDPAGTANLTFHIEDFVQTSAGAINPTYTDPNGNQFNSCTIAFH